MANTGLKRCWNATPARLGADYNHMWVEGKYQGSTGMHIYETATLNDGGPKNEGRLIVIKRTADEAEEYAHRLLALVAEIRERGV